MDTHKFDLTSGLIGFDKETVSSYWLMISISVGDRQTAGLLRRMQAFAIVGVNGQQS